MSDVFQSNGTTNFATSEIEVIVNGTSRGKVKAGSTILGDFIRQQAQSNGLRTFAAYVDGYKLDTTRDAASLKAQVTASKLELVAKDSRG